MSNKTGDKTIEDDEKSKGGGGCCGCCKKRKDNLSAGGSTEGVINPEQAAMYQSKPAITSQAYYYNPPPSQQTSTPKSQNQYTERRYSPQREYEVTRQKSAPSATYTVRTNDLPPVQSPAYKENVSTTKYSVNIQQTGPIESNQICQEIPPARPVSKAPIPQVCHPPPPPKSPPPQAPPPQAPPPQSYVPQTPPPQSYVPRTSPSPHVHPTIHVPTNQFSSPPRQQQPCPPCPPPCPPPMPTSQSRPPAHSSQKPNRCSPSHAPSPIYAQSPIYSPLPPGARQTPDSHITTPTFPHPQPAPRPIQESQINYRSSQQISKPIQPETPIQVYKQPPSHPPPQNMQPVYENRPAPPRPPCPVLQEAQQPIYTKAPPPKPSKPPSEKSGRASTSAPVQTYGGSTSAVTEDEKSQAKKGCCATKNKPKGIGAIHPVINEYKVDGHLNVKGKINQATISIPTDSYLVTR